METQPTPGPAIAASIEGEEAVELPKHKLRVPRARKGELRLWIGTRKGLFCLDGDAGRQTFSQREPFWLGATIFHAVADPRDRDTVLVALRTTEGRATVALTRDGGRTWSLSEEPPRFSEESPFEPDESQEDAASPRWLRSVHQVFWLTAGHPSEYGTFYAGTSPQGLFRSADFGATWEPVNGLNRHPDFDAWTHAGEDGTPDGPKLHSIQIDPRDADHMIAGLSMGGVVETLDGGVTWARLEAGLDGEAALDVHSVAMGVTNPDRLWMQAREGVYRTDLETRVWERVSVDVIVEGSESEPLDAGFPIAVHPADPDVAFTFPMDGSDAWTRMPRNGQPVVAKTTDGGRTWSAQRAGFPKEASWWTVKRQCLAVDGYDPLGVYIGTSTGEVWFSRDEGEKWRCVARGLPHIYSVEVG